ncbi:MAG: primosomal protein N' [Myxococcales bacterium]|nr:primosomal protein N' [Myxococcales bacterium]
MLLVDVALPVPLARIFSYSVPPALAERIVSGMRVVCPFGSRRLVGVALGLREGEPPPGVRAVAETLDDKAQPTVPPELLSFMREVASYYLAPLGEVLKLALPPLDRKTADALREPMLFADKKGLSSRKILWVVPTAGGGEGSDAATRGQGKAILAHLRAAGESSIARLEETWSNARAACKRLEELGLVRLDARDAPSDPFFSEEARPEPVPELTPPQADAGQALEEALGAASSGTRTFLLDGVTGSGKTEVYLRAIRAARERKLGTVVLVPEIALTPQLVARFRGRFGDDVAVLHSALTPRERHDMWRRLRSGEVDVAIGARSALFAPVGNLGLVVVDEEHDPSFKQEEGVRYHARDMAILRAHRAGGVCVLGSATPSLESEHLVRGGRARRLLLPARARAQAMPTVEIVDLRRMGAGPTGDKRISLPLHRAIEKALEQGEQIILFLNRRGFAPSVRCTACGHLAACPSCSVALTFHKKRGERLRCHYCDYECAVPSQCEKCAAKDLSLEGIGTEKLEESLGLAFPTARIARLDRDVATGRTVDTILERVRSREVDILVGTQMVTKGHDLPHVTLVGAINADAALSIPDFRAAERAFHLLVQVAGRAGRGDKPGRVLVQTYAPEHPAIEFAARHDTKGFVERELADRRELRYPPYSRLALVRVDAEDEALALAATETLATVARDVASGEKGVDVLGPAPAPLPRLRLRFRFRLMVRAADRAALRRVLVAVDAARSTLSKDVRAVVDVDPVQLL